MHFKQADFGSAAAQRRKCAKRISVKPTATCGKRLSKTALFMNNARPRNTLYNKVDFFRLYFFENFLIFFKKGIDKRKEK